MKSRILRQHPSLLGLNAIVVSIVLDEGERGQRLLEQMVANFLTATPETAQSKTDPPWWAKNLNELLWFCSRHDITVQLPPGAADWFRRCIDVDVNLSAALGLLGPEAQREAEGAGHFNYPRLFPFSADSP
jgi:hypothetical protein